MAMACVCVMAHGYATPGLCDPATPVTDWKIMKGPSAVNSPTAHPSESVAPCEAQSFRDLSLLKMAVPLLS